jgi:hypothetical protein
MKKYYYFLIFLYVAFTHKVSAQINYSFTALGGAYTANAAPTVLHSTNVDDALSAATSIGFTFQYGCTNYTQFMASTNGVMFLGNTAVSTNSFNDLTGSTDRPAIAPLWDDLKTGSAGNVNYLLTGAVGSRILTVEWKQMYWNYAGATNCISFQVKLYETSNRIDFVYTQGAAAINSGSASIGISGVTSGDFYSLNGAGAAPTASKVTETTTIAAKPANGQIYRWDPVQCSGTPAGGTAAASVTSSACGGYASTISLSGNSSGCGISYQWYSSPNNATWTIIAGATSSTYAATVNTSIYYHCVITCSNSGLSGTSTSIQCTVTSPSPANDACASAVSLGTVSTTTTTTGSNSCASADQSSSCHSPTENVWYTFTVPAGGGSYVVSVAAGTIVDPCISVYSGTCAGLTNVVCTYGSTSSASVNANCLAAGTYYINVDDDFGTAGTFSITVTQTSAGTTVANDACASAISLGTVSTTTTTTGTNACATADQSSSCHSPTENVWYTFTVPAGGGAYLISVAAGTMVDPCISVYSGTCGSFSSISCTYGSASSASVSATCLAAGTYYINVDDDIGTAGTFSITVQQTISGASIPANDLCAGAVNLGSVSTTTTTTGDNTCAHADETSSTCSTFSQNVWYKFTVPAGGGSYSFNVASSTLYEPGIAVFSGTCGAFTQIACNDYCSGSGTSSSVSTKANCLAAGTYYISVDDDAVSCSGTQGTFSLTVTQVSAGTSVANDACASAISLGTVSTTTTVVGNNNCATADQTSPTCFTYKTNVWYTFTVPAGGGSYDITVTGGTIYEPGVAIFSGACGGFTLKGCNDYCAGSGTTTSVTKSINCIAAGTYYISVDDDQSGCSGTTGSFSLTVVQTVSGSGAPSNDNCAGAILLTCGSTCTQTAGSTACATQTIAGCLGTANDDVWYKFVATHTTEYINVTASPSFDPVVQLFSGACNGTSIWCNDASFTTGSAGSAVATGLTVGSTYLIRVYDYGSGVPTTTSFSICITDPPSCPANLGTGVVAVASLPYSSLGNTTCGKVNDITAGTGANSDVANVCGSSSYYGGEDAVYTFTPTTTGVVTITQSNTSGTVGMMLYSSCPFSGTCVANAQSSDASRTICLTLTAGTTYYLIIDSWPSPSCYLYDISISAPVVGTPAGTACASADPVTSLPFSKTGITTCCKGNDYTSANACTDPYMNGEDYVFSYTPASNITIDITLSNTLAYTAVFVTKGCPDVGTCVANNDASGGNPSLCGIALTGGTTYYIIVDTDPTPSCTPFDIVISQNSASATCNLAYTAATTAFSSTDPLTTGTLLTFPDDHFATAYTPIGFNFCFDGIQYSQLLVSSNGYLIFDPFGCTTNLPGSNAAPSSYSAWSISGAIPNTTNAPRNAILGPWQDIDPGVAGNIRYQTYGVTPNQRFVVSFENVAMFQCNSVLFSGQIKLFEGTNNIEVHLTSKQLCTTWNGGQAILGLHNYNGTIAVVPTGGYNAPTQWTASSKAWLFSTACATCVIILPIELSSFTGKKFDDKSNLINWETKTETNTKEFILERSTDGTTFETAAILPAKNSATGASYQYQDNILDKNQTYYYRLATVDFNGAVHKSGLVVVERRPYLFTAFSLYPNPASTILTLEGETNAAGGVKISVYDILGKNVGEQNVELINGLNSINIPVQQYTSGMYYIKVVSNDGTDKLLFIQKVIKE